MTVDLIKGYLDIFLEIEARVLRFLFFILADLSINERCCVDVGKMIFWREKNKFNISLQLFTPLCIARRALSFNGFRFDNKRKLYFVFHVSSFLSLSLSSFLYLFSNQADKSWKLLNRKFLFKLILVCILFIDTICEIRLRSIVF